MKGAAKHILSATPAPLIPSAGARAAGAAMHLPQVYPPGELYANTRFCLQSTP